MRDQWFCRVDGQQYGPFSWDQLKAMAVEGRLIAESTVRRGVDQQWYPASKVPGLLSKPSASNGSSSGKAPAKAAAAATAPSEPAATAASKPSKPAKPAGLGESQSSSESFRLVTSREKPPAVATPPSPPPVSPPATEAPIISITPVGSPAPAVVAAPPVAKKAATTVTKKNNRTLLAIAAAAGLLIVVGGGAGAWMALGGREDSKQIAAKTKPPAAPAPSAGEAALTDAAEAVESAVDSAASFGVSTAEASSDGIDPLAVATAAAGGDSGAADKVNAPPTSAPGSDAKADAPVDAAAPAEAPAEGEAPAPDAGAIEAKAAIASVGKWADLSTVPGIAFNKVRIEPEAIWLASDALGEWFEPPTGDEPMPEKSIADLTAADSKLGIDTSGPRAKFVFVQIKLTSIEPRKYTGWNNTVGPAAALCDQDDNALKLVAVSDTPDVKRLGATDLEPEKPVMELLVFEAPKTPIKSLKLALARNALSDKSKGYMGFAIPLEVLQNKPAYLPGIDDVKGPPGEERPPELDLKRQIEGLKKNDAFEQPPPAEKK